jgi:hypothetical protein
LAVITVVHISPSPRGARPDDRNLKRTLATTRGDLSHTVGNWRDAGQLMMNLTRLGITTLCKNTILLMPQNILKKIFLEEILRKAKVGKAIDDNVKNHDMHA